jgi:hypothetical protein
MVRLEARIQKTGNRTGAECPTADHPPPGYGPEFDRQVAEAKATGARVVVSHLDWAPGRLNGWMESTLRAAST